MESVTREQIERTINATDSEDALKYLPSLLVRKRYIGDYNHAILSSRASGTGNSARSAVYADGILLSNYLGNGVGGPELPAALGHGHARGDRARRRDVRAVLGRLPGQFGRRRRRLHDAHAEGLRGARASVGYTSQPFELYGTDATYPRLGDQRLGRQPQRRLLVVAERQPHRQPRPAAHLRDASAGNGTAGSGRHAGDGRRARTPTTRAAPGTCSAPAPSTGRGRTTSRSSWPTTSRRRCAPTTCSGSGQNASDSRAGLLPARRRRQRGLQRRRSTSTAWRTPARRR